VNQIVATVANAGNPDAWTVTRSHQRRDELNELLTNQTNLTTAFATGGIEHSLSTGVEFIYERHSIYPSVASGTQAAANLYNPSTADSFSTLARSGAHSEGKTTTGGIYLFDNLRFNDQWSLNAGVRFDRYNTDSITVPAPATPPAASSYLEGDGNLITGKVGLVFKPVPFGSIYVAYANSEQPPGGVPQGNGNTPNFALNPGTAINNPALEPQLGTNFEVGTKWDLLSNRLVLTAAVFDTRNKNDQVNAPDPVTGEYTQYGERKVRGYELGVAGAITANWQINLGFADMKTEVVEGTAAQAGAQLPFSPETTFTSWTTYSFPFGFRIGGGARYVDSSFRNGNATQATVTNLATSPSYWVVDLMAAYDFSEKLSVQLNAQNVTDEFYLASLNNGGSRYTLGTPRTIQLTAALKF
jgi:catecholate siderophore receptor